MKIKTAEATGLALDWGLALALEYEPSLYEGQVVRAWICEYEESEQWGCPVFKVVNHTAGSVCMGLIEQYKPDLVYRAEEWGAEIKHMGSIFWSPCLARAVARCVVAMKFGESFECPDEIGEQS